ncbi:hypothetical protein [Embleya scabrispora]|uniref:hypothetical protein n=1 Tax=Embleya scabrispora TaxID=159449 RepID=UPI0004762DC9|nr:hypothetical protein [Embleya scabrispora]MYS85720.1 hypothetical protein [Streptomyces sp. SID5474]
MSDQHQHDDRPGEPAAEGEQFETVWDRAANGGVGGWVRRRVTAAPTAVNPDVPPRPHHQPTAHLPAAGPPRPAGQPQPTGPPRPPAEQDTVDNPAARGLPAGPPPPAWPVPAPPPLPRPAVPPGESAPPADWFQHERGPSPLPPGGTFADAAHTPVHGYGMPPARDVPAAPDWYRGATPPPPGPLSPAPPGPSFERTLLFIVVAVVFVAALGTLFALRPWEDDKTTPAAHGSESAGQSSAGSPTPSGTGSGGQSGLPPATPPSQGSAVTTPPPTTAAPDARAQATALDSLISRSGSSRQSVIDAVNNVGSCSSLAASRSALLDAAAQRDQLVTQLDAMRFDGVPELQSAAPTLRTAWTASARADRAFAAWAQSAADSGCPGTRSLYDDGATISAEASSAKKSFVDTWNTVASRYGLTSRSELDL